jgi:hypothetical protein
LPCQGRNAVCYLAMCNKVCEVVPCPIPPLKHVHRPTFVTLACRASKSSKSDFLRSSHAGAALTCGQTWRSSRNMRPNPFLPDWILSHVKHEPGLDGCGCLHVCADCFFLRRVWSHLGTHLKQYKELKDRNQGCHLCDFRFASICTSTHLRLLL